MKELLQQASAEIQQLRSRNAILEAKVEVMEVFKAALYADTTQRMGAAPDVVWALEKKIPAPDVVWALEKKIRELADQPASG